MLPLSALTALGLALASPAQAADADCVTVQPTGVRGADLKLGGASNFELVLAIERTCGRTVRLRRLDYIASINGAHLASRSTEYDSLKLTVGDPVEVVVPVELDAGLAAGAIISALTTGRLELALSGEASVRWFVFPFKLDFDERIVDVALR